MKQVRGKKSEEKNYQFLAAEKLPGLTDDFFELEDEDLDFAYVDEFQDSTELLNITVQASEKNHYHYRRL